jgi:hypothetical protein
MIEMDLCVVVEVFAFLTGLTKNTKGKGEYA